MAADIFVNLPGITWRGIPLPVSAIRNQFTQDHVEHKFFGNDVVHVEATGRNPLTFTVHMPFNNGVEPGPSDGWAGQTLFPDLFRKVVKACFDRSSGEFNHPDFGPITCKARDVSWDYMATKRDGVELVVRFYESSGDDRDIADLLAAQAPMANAFANAKKLDDEIDAAGPLPELSNDTKSFSDMMIELDNGTGGVGPINSKLGNTNDALERLDDVGFWPLRSALEDMRAAVIDLGPSAGQSGRGSVRIHTVTFGTSIPGLAMRLGISSDDVIRMNPKLARHPYVAEGTNVRYVFVGP